MPVIILVFCYLNEMLLNLSMEYVERSEKLSRFHQITEENKRNKQ